MKILHLIDSLNPGGAERMAVSYVNVLAEQGVEAHLWATREEGLLKETIAPGVHYRFLNRRGPLGLRALLKASQLIEQKHIQLIHAHSTSWFFGTLLKWLNPSVKLIWHDHYGSRPQSLKQATKTLVFCSKYFSRVVAVNKDLVRWHQTHLRNNQSDYIPNFVSKKGVPVDSDLKSNTSNTIICVANLRKPKNHVNLIKAFSKLHKTTTDWNLLLVGKTIKDSYSDTVYKSITKESLSEAVKVLGERADVYKLLNKAEIGVLSSDMEGLPMTLLEYALSGLAVVTTDVGYCSEVVQDYGKVVPPGNPEALAKALEHYISHPEERTKDAANLRRHVLENYTDEAVIPRVLKLYSDLLKN